MAYWYNQDDLKDDRQYELNRLPERYGQNEEQVRERYLNPYGYREVLHTSFIFQENVGTYLLKHPSVFLNEEAYRLAWVAEQALFDLYQCLGKLEADADENP